MLVTRAALARVAVAIGSSIALSASLTAQLAPPPAGGAGVSAHPQAAAKDVAWRQFRNGAAHTGSNPRETILGPAQADRLVVLWQAQAGSIALGDGIFAPPSVVDGVVYVNSMHGTLNAFDAQDGSLRWSVVTGGYGDSAPAIAGGHVLVGSITGLQAWPIGCQGRCSPDWIAGDTTVNPSLTVADGRVFAGEYSGWLRVYDLATGAPLWSAQVNQGDPVFGSPTVADGRVYVAGDGGLYAFAADGSSGSQPLWVRPTTYGCEKSPAIVGGVAYVVDDQGGLYAVDGASGVLLWSAPTGFLANTPAVADGRVFVTTAYGQVFAFPAECSAHCAPLWTVELGPGKGLFGPVVANGVVWCGSIDLFFTEGTLYAFDASSGAQLAAHPVDGAIESEPVVIDGRVYVGTMAGRVYAFALP